MSTTFLTDEPGDTEFLTNLSRDSSIAQRNRLIQKHLTCLVPFIDNVKPSDLLKIRATEEEAFVLFRRELSKAVDEFRGTRVTLIERDVHTIYHDLIAPKLALLDLKIKAARRALIKGARRKLLGWTGAISLGLYTGFVPEGIAAAAAALGLTRVLAEFTEGLMSGSDTEEPIRSNDMYFLWKVNKEGQK